MSRRRKQLHVRTQRRGGRFTAPSARTTTTMPRHTQQRSDTRIVFGARCVWWDSIAQASRNGAGLPCCPHCHGVLFEAPDENAWWSSAAEHENNGHPGYVAFIQWMRGRCYPDMPAARAAYEQEIPT